MRPSLDSLRYGLRALDEMAREQASVAMPPRLEGATFEPHPRLRPPARDGAALSLRMFSDAADDATALMTAEAPSHTFAPIPARAAPLFEAHAALLAQGGEDELVLGFPLATFVQLGSTRVAPLFSRGGVRASWKMGETAWTSPAGARVDAQLMIPDRLVLEAGDSEDAYALHGGLWHLLFGFDGAAVTLISAAGSRGLGALVRAATHALVVGIEDASFDTEVKDGPLERAHLHAFCEAATARGATSRYALRCHPHGLAMLAPRGDPTSGLRRDLRELLEDVAPERGPLAVYLGAPGPPSRHGSEWTCSRSAPPTASQLAAARAFEGTSDLVAVRGPPGCGKTALLHHVAAQAVVARALDDTWVKPPGASAAAWALVVTSTNNAAVDHALAPFVRAPALSLPLALRLGNRRTLTEGTAAQLAHAMEALSARGEASLKDARAVFETLARPVREHVQALATARQARDMDAAKKRNRDVRAATLREALARTPEDAPLPPVAVAALDESIRALREHLEALSRLVALHLEGKRSSVERACAKWTKANDVRSTRIVPVLTALAMDVPFGDLDAADPHSDVARQRASMQRTLVELTRASEVLAAPALRHELAALTAELAGDPSDGGAPPFVPDPALFDAALAVRDAWARANSAVLLVALRRAFEAVGEGSNRPAHPSLRHLAALFPVAGCTLLSMRSVFPLEDSVIDRLVIDEAAQCAPVYAAPALARARRVMLTGDTAQLPPVYTLDPRADERLARGLNAAAIAPFRMGAASTASAQSAAEPRASARVELVEHFRSQPAIVALASRWSGYVLDVRTPERSLEGVSPRLRMPVAVMPVHGLGERAAEGVVNAAEAIAAVALVEELLRDGVNAGDVAVLTPFVGQCVRIERELHARGLLSKFGAQGVLVSTVHRLQGGERRVIVLSIVATQRRHLRWLAERPHLLHVATSRAQDHLLVLVDPTAARQEPGLLPFHEQLQMRSE
jgi:hypothetical protein